MQVLRRISAEALGTALLLAVVIGSGIMGEQLSQGTPAVALLANSIATGAALFVLILLFGPISGAHFNPVVTLAQVLNRHLSLRLGLLYVTAQVSGAILGVVLAHAMFDLPLWQVSEKVRTGPGQWLAEATATFGLLLVVLNASAWSLHTTAAAVGLYITSAYWFTASTSFANPAVTLARCWSNTFAGIMPTDAPAFMVAQLAGLLLALAVFYALFRPPVRPPPAP
jgi:glycerol uptake facilitator-like aquaporin